MCSREENQCGVAVEVITNVGSKLRETVKHGVGQRSDSVEVVMKYAS